ncbi:beta-1,3-galactosyltransferase 1-like [Dendronephthya gigantea]|uniref:beta-1,3-galactosyltransferase 1-like n=1 Tax=Dendronephthya gigantea TaxID=151771 RepID=UPI00106D317F|nr:beta-1,3-galactosyltransferase 1-like [Dendronephthya gigantea]
MIYKLVRVSTRSYRRVFVLLLLCLLLYFANWLYSYIIDFYVPTMQPQPVRKDMSNMPVISGQEHFIPSLIEPVVSEDNLFILVLINSAAGSESHFQKRMAIRKTWGKPIIGHKKWKIAFFLGKTNKRLTDEKRLMEAKQYGDIIIGDFPDTYRNITQKLMMAFKWTSKINYKYLLKTDDDVYVNIPLLITWINGRLHPNEPLYAGVLYRAKIIRDPSHRHFVRWSDLPQQSYPWYPKGALYVLSSDVVQEMLKIVSRVKMITVDDAYVGVLASYVGVRPVYLNGFIQWGFLPELVELFDRCTYSNIIGMADNMSPDDIYFVHQEVTSLQNSSKWMCIHVSHPILATVGLVIFLLLVLYTNRHKLI